MRKIQRLLPFSLSSQNVFLRQYSAPDYNVSNKTQLHSAKIHILNTIKNLLQDLKHKNRSELQRFVKSKTVKYQLQNQIGLSKVCSLVDLKYILFSLIQAQQEQNYIGNFSRISPLSPQTQPINGARKSQAALVNAKGARRGLQSQQRDIGEWSRATKGKKTNIYIDFDFSEMLQKCQRQVQGKQSLIQRLQNFIIEKDRQIQLLEDQNQQLRAHIEQLIYKIKANSVREQDRVAIQKKLNDIEQENKILNQQANNLAAKITFLQSQNDQPPQQLFRRCLFSQAITLQNFLYDN